MLELWKIYWIQCWRSACYQTCGKIILIAWRILRCYSCRIERMEYVNRQDFWYFLDKIEYYKSQFMGKTTGFEFIHFGREIRAYLKKIDPSTITGRLNGGVSNKALTARVIKSNTFSWLKSSQVKNFIKFSSLAKNDRGLFSEKWNFCLWLSLQVKPPSFLYLLFLDWKRFLVLIPTLKFRPLLTKSSETVQYKIETNIEDINIFSSKN